MKKIKKGLNRAIPRVLRWYSILAPSLLIFFILLPQSLNRILGLGFRQKTESHKWKGREETDSMGSKSPNTKTSNSPITIATMNSSSISIIPTTRSRTSSTLTTLTTIQTTITMTNTSTIPTINNIPPTITTTINTWTLSQTIRRRLALEVSLPIVAPVVDMVLVLVLVPVPVQVPPILYAKEAGIEEILQVFTNVM